MANKPNLFSNKAVGFIDWLGRRVVSPIAAEKQFRNATKGQSANDCPDADPLPPGRSKLQKPEAVTE